jgi:hypothetical protein
MLIWCIATLVLGAVFAAAAFPATDGLARFYYAMVSGGTLRADFLEADGFRFTVAVLGAVLIGWGVTILALIRAAEAAPSAAWQGLTASMVIWFVIDSALSVMTGFPLNAVPNAVFLLTYLIPVLASGVLKAGASLARA